MARSMRKRHREKQRRSDVREKQRRSDVNPEFTFLIELLRKIIEYDSNSDDNDDENDDNSVVTPPTKRIRIKRYRHSAVTTSTNKKN